MDRNLLCPGNCSDHQIKSLFFVLRSKQKIIFKKPCIHLYDLLDVLDLVHELHLCHPPDVLELPDLPDHTEHTEAMGATEKNGATETIKGGALLFLFLLCVIRSIRAIR